MLTSDLLVCVSTCENHVTTLHSVIIRTKKREQDVECTFTLQMLQCTNFPVHFVSCPFWSPLTFHSAAYTCHVIQVAQKAAISRSSTVSVRAQAVAAPLKPASVPIVMEEGPMPINTFGPKAPFIARIRSVEKIVGPKATGETFHVIIETDGKIPYWEGQSYGVIPPVRQSHSWAWTVHQDHQRSMTDQRRVGAGAYFKQFSLHHIPIHC